MASKYVKIVPILCRQMSVVPRSCVSSVPARLFWSHRPWNSLLDLSSSVHHFENRMRELEREMDKILIRSFPNRRDDESSVKTEVVGDGKNRKLEITLNLGDFKPEDVKVSVKDKMLTVHAKKEGVDGSAKSTQVSYRRFDSLPNYVELESLKCHMSSDGVLKVEGILPQIGVGDGEVKEIPTEKVKEIPIEKVKEIPIEKVKN